MDSEGEVIIEFDRKKLFVSVITIVFLGFISATYISALFAFDAPSHDSPLQIIDVLTLDLNNITQTTFTKGTDTLRLNSSIEMALRYMNFPWSNTYYNFFGDVSFKIIVTIMDGNKVPMRFVYKDGVISPGGIYFDIVDYPIPSGATSGTYTAKVMVWSDWLPDGDALSTVVGEVTFSVV